MLDLIATPAQGEVRIVKMGKFPSFYIMTMITIEMGKLLSFYDDNGNGYNGNG